MSTGALNYSLHIINKYLDLYHNIKIRYLYITKIYLHLSILFIKKITLNIFLETYIICMWETYYF